MNKVQYFFSNARVILTKEESKCFFIITFSFVLKQKKQKFKTGKLNAKNESYSLKILKLARMVDWFFDSKSCRAQTVEFF
ncbi:hypothetical protein DRF68_15545 [Candidatus Chryseobacterium massiliae]|uniref:Uncharacterized protein n=1 Tax=Candidatus Chryseobacterium massiliense TaxID=204089 RepID=A0A3D9AW73_9FLAO|nr:hypothetical protein DRF68_15545 [Candidatus Chryseobacterium massiliae]